LGSAVGAQSTIREYAEVGKFVLEMKSQGVLGGNGVRLYNKIIIAGVLYQLLKADAGGVIHFEILEQAAYAFYHICIKKTLFIGIDHIQPIKLDRYDDGRQQSGGQDDPF